MNKFLDIFALAGKHWQEVLIGGLMIVSAIISVMGILKKFVIGKISNKLLRKFTLSASSVALSFPLVALYFFIKNINYDYYWMSCGSASVATVLVYWVYENTCCRDLINALGKKFFLLIFNTLAKSFSADDSLSQVQKKLKSSTVALEEDVKKEIKKSISKHDDLKNL